MAIVQNLLQIWMPKLVYSFYLTLDNIKMCFFNFHNFDFTAPLTLENNAPVQQMVSSTFQRNLGQDLGRKTLLVLVSNFL